MMEVLIIVGLLLSGPGNGKCNDFDWTTGGACVDEIPGGFPAVNGKDRGTDRGPCVPFGCCDVGTRNIMVVS
jgi:hypothetical protein